MKPTDEDVWIAKEALYRSPHDLRPDVRAALEAYTHRLIERLAREAEKYDSAGLMLANKGDTHGHHMPLSHWLRSFVEKNHD